MSVGIKEQNLKTAQDIFSLIKSRFHADANFRLLVDALPKDVVVSLEEAASICKQVSPGFVVSQAWTDIWGEFFQQHPEVKTCDANISMLMEALMDVLGVGEQDFLTSGTSIQDLNQVLTRREVRAQLAFTEEHHQAEAEVKERAALIQSISQGKKSYTWRRPADGKVEVYETKGLEGEPTQRLRDINAAITEQRRLLAADPSQVRKEVAQAAKAQNTSQQTELPTHWVPDHDGRESNIHEPIKAGQRIELTRTNFMRLDKDDMRKIINRFGSAAVDRRIKGLA